MTRLEDSPKLPNVGRILSQDNYADIDRPWLIHFKIVKDNMKTIECTGSLLNRRSSNFVSTYLFYTSLSFFSLALSGLGTIQTNVVKGGVELAQTPEKNSNPIREGGLDFQSGPG